ncbi:IS66 family insertion sequence element accessory protein TnpB [Amorphus sp. 3PC139-8]
MIPVPSAVRVWLATGHTYTRKGFPGFSLVVQETLKRDPHNGHLFVFRGRRGELLKVIWHDGHGVCLYTKRLERGRFLWPPPVDGVVTITPEQLGYLLEGVDWRMPQRTWRPGCIGLMKAVAGLDRPKLRGVDRVGWAFTFAAAAYNLIRLPKLLAPPA